MSNSTGKQNPPNGHDHVDDKYDVQSAEVNKKLERTFIEIPGTHTEQTDTDANSVVDRTKETKHVCFDVAHDDEVPTTSRALSIQKQHDIEIENVMKLVRLGADKKGTTTDSDDDKDETSDSDDVWNENFDGHKDSIAYEDELQSGSIKIDQQKINEFVDELRKSVKPESADAASPLAGCKELTDSSQHLNCVFKSFAAKLENNQEMKRSPSRKRKNGKILRSNRPRVHRSRFEDFNDQRTKHKLKITGKKPLHMSTIQSNSCTSMMAFKESLYGISLREGQINKDLSSITLTTCKAIKSITTTTTMNGLMETSAMSITQNRSKELQPFTANVIEAPKTNSMLVEVEHIGLATPPLQSAVGTMRVTETVDKDEANPTAGTLVDNCCVRTYFISCGSKTEPNMLTDIGSTPVDSAHSRPPVILPTVPMPKENKPRPPPYCYSSTETALELGNRSLCDSPFHTIHIDGSVSPSARILHRPPIYMRFWRILSDLFNAFCVCLHVNRDCIFCVGFFIAFVVSASFLTAFFYRTLSITPHMYQRASDIPTVEARETNINKRLIVERDISMG